jgi:hypothetical protein
LILILGCKKASPAGEGKWPAPTGTFHLDGEADEPDWNARALRTGPFVDEAGGIARPYSEARLLADKTTVYLMLYAADQDIHSDEYFEIGGLKLFANGTASDPSVKLGVDRDGTIDDTRDDDEEWVIEAAVPRALIPRPLVITRCDTPKDGGRRCGKSKPL